MTVIGNADDSPLRVVRYTFEVGMEWRVRADSDEEALAIAKARYENYDCDEVLYDRIIGIKVLPL